MVWREEGRIERDFARDGEEEEKEEKEGQSGSGNDRPSALEANIDECPALLALRNPVNVESLSFSAVTIRFFLREALPREKLKRSQAKTLNANNDENM